jgi:hypothetical protein
MIQSSKESIRIEFNDSSYIININTPQGYNRIEAGTNKTFYISSVKSHKIGIEVFFNALKNTTTHSVLSIYSGDSRFVVEHIDAHLHLNVGNPHSIRDKATFLIEWQVNVIGAL